MDDSIPMAQEFTIYSDESIARGEKFSNFYGGALVRARDLVPVIESLKQCKRDAGIGGEAKWKKVGKTYLPRYVAFVERFFDLIEADRVKVRIMFTHNRWRPTGLTPEHRENRYFILYYYFLRYAFGLRYSNEGGGAPIRLRIYPDQLPDNSSRVAQFKRFIASLANTNDFRLANICVPKDQIAEVRSHDHAILQALDLVLGSIAFRLNNRHRMKPEGSSTRADKTRAKEALYRVINRRIREIYPNFNIGITTGTRGDYANRWRHPYRHWCFKPTESEQA